MPDITPHNINRSRVGRPTKATANERVVQIASMLLSAKTRTEIIDFCGKTYGLKPTSVNNIVTLAYQYIAETHKVDRDATVILHLQYYYELYVTAKALGDTRGAVACLNSIEKLMKLTTPDALIQQNHLSVNLKDMTLTDLKELLQLK